jgi:hypothetical protein
MRDGCLCLILIERKRSCNRKSIYLLETDAMLHKLQWGFAMRMVVMSWPKRFSGMSPWSGPSFEAKRAYLVSCKLGLLRGLNHIRGRSIAPQVQ